MYNFKYTKNVSGGVASEQQHYHQNIESIQTFLTEALISKRTGISSQIQRKWHQACSIQELNSPLFQKVENIRMRGKIYVS